MQVTGKVVVVTGGANGIGKAMCEAFDRAGAARVVVADIDPDGARAVSIPIDGAAFKCDVGKEKDAYEAWTNANKEAKTFPWKPRSTGMDIAVFGGLVAGIFHMPYWSFQIANFTSAFLWAGVLLTLGDVVAKIFRWVFGS